MSIERPQDRQSERKERQIAKQRRRKMHLLVYGSTIKEAEEKRQRTASIISDSMRRRIDGDRRDIEET